MQTKKDLLAWNSEFKQIFQHIPHEQRDKAGVMLPYLLAPSDWTDFLELIKHEWQHWRKNLNKYSYCLLMLYDGLAFYEYESGSFWPSFAKVIGIKKISPNIQTEINSAFLQEVEKLGLYFRTQDYNGSAIYHIGIPLSLWDGFLDICEWALLNKWEHLDDKEWEQEINKRTIGRPRLARFLINNRNAANELINEMLDARRILNDDDQESIDSLKDALIFCRVYIDEVPETADFLRPSDPESLLKDRAQVVWDQQRDRITVHLPPVPQNKLPANWQIFDIDQIASSSADEIILNAKAFKSLLNLQLNSEQDTEKQRLRGLHPFGIFDLDNGGHLINPARKELPLRNYVLVSDHEINGIRFKGFNEETAEVNEEFELSDGTTCYITNLWPTGKYAELYIKNDESDLNIQFRRRSKIEARFFAGESMRSANFSRMPDKIKMDGLPILCVSIPCGYFSDNLLAIESKFNVLIDSKQAGGKWEQRETHLDDDKEFYFWRWNRKPLIKQIKFDTLNNFKDLGKCYKSPDLKGDRIFSIQAPNLHESFKVFIDDKKTEMKDCWKNLPGAFLPWFLLCQSTDGMKWDDLLLARDIISPKLFFNGYVLRKYEQYGLLKLKGKKWIIEESRAVIKKINIDDELQIKYCGDPSILWSLYRRMSYEDDYMPCIEVIDKRGKPPHLQMVWKLHYKEIIEKYLRKLKVRLCGNLWNL